MAKTFDLGAALSDVLKNVSDPDRGPEQIVLLPIASINADANNFYSMDGVEELAANIELIGLLDPLRVRENPDMPGRYLIVSGHRRRAALWTLYESEPEKWGKAPCIVEPAAASPELQELRLIYANADTRRMTGADIDKQAQRIQVLLSTLKEQGVVQFSGRMRDRVAEACKVSATRLANLKVIREKLIPALQPLWEEGKLVESCAYRIAQESPEMQLRLVSDYGAASFRTLPLWQIEQAIAVRKPRPEPMETTDSFDHDAYGAELEHERKLLRKAIKEHWAPRFAATIRNADTRMKAIDALKIGYRHAGTGGMPVDYDGKPNGLEVKWRHEKKFLARWADIYDQLALLAIQELYRRFEMDRAKPKSAPTVSDAQRLISVDDRYPDEGQYVFAYKRDFTAIPSVYFRAAFMDCEERSVANKRLTGIEYWSPRPQLPAGKKWPGQETIEGMVQR